MAIVWLLCGYCVAIVWLMCGYCVANVWLVCSSGVISQRSRFGYAGISYLAHGLLAMLRESQQHVKQRPENGIKKAIEDVKRRCELLYRAKGGLFDEREEI